MTFKLDWNLKRKPGSSHSSYTTAPSDDGLTTTPSHARSHASTQHSSVSGSDGSRLRLVRSASSFLSRTLGRSNGGSSRKSGSNSNSHSNSGHGASDKEKNKRGDGSRRHDNSVHISNRSQDGLGDVAAPTTQTQPAVSKGHCRNRGRDEAEEFRRCQESLNTFRFQFGRTRPRRTSDIYAISPCNSYQFIYADDD